MKIEKVLVTGGAGFIGSHMVDAYLRAGARVTVVDNLSTGTRANLNPDAEFIEADIRDAATLKLFDDRHFDLVNHHAAQIDVRVSVADPASDAETNVVASVRLMQEAATSGVKKFIFASSGGAAYGEPAFAPQSEEHPIAPTSPYGCAKVSAEHYLNYFRMIAGLSGVALRYGNVYGPRQNARGEAGVIAIFIALMLEGKDITINGDGGQTRDFVHVGDVVRANLAVTHHDLEGAFNVGTGVETSVNTLTRLLLQATGASSTVNHGPGKAGEQMRSVLDGRKLMSIAGLPEPVKLEDGLRETIAWYRR